MKERIIGHSTGLDDVYYTPEQSELYEEYTKAINALTINEENRLKEKVRQYVIKADQIDGILLQIEDMKRKLGLS